MPIVNPENPQPRRGSCAPPAKKLVFQQKTVLILTTHHVGSAYSNVVEVVSPQHFTSCYLEILGPIEGSGALLCCGACALGKGRRIGLCACSNLVGQYPKALGCPTGMGGAPTLRMSWPTTGESSTTSLDWTASRPTSGEQLGRQCPRTVTPQCH
jgi:hypothetical protein